MRDYMSIGSTPANEDCAQVGSDDYSLRMRAETKTFVNQIKRHYPPAEGCAVTVKGFPHDFGTYHEVVVTFDPDVPEQIEYAYAVEADEKGVLGEWDDQARMELADAIIIAKTRAA